MPDLNDTQEKIHDEISTLIMINQVHQIKDDLISKIRKKSLTLNARQKICRSPINKYFTTKNVPQSNKLQRIHLIQA